MASSIGRLSRSPSSFSRNANGVRRGHGSGGSLSRREPVPRIVLWLSFFTAITGFIGLTIFGLTFGLGALIVVRFLFGMGEAGAYPNITRSLHNWFPVGERAVAQGTVWMAGRFMGGMTPLIW